MRWIKKSVLVGGAGLLLSSWGWTAFPSQFTYQGSLKQNGALVNGTYPMEFRLTNSDGSQTYWTSGVQNISVQEGLYRVELSPTNVDWGNIEPYVQVSVNGNVLLPREKLNSAPYAMITKELAPDTLAQGNVRMMGRLGIGELLPSYKLHIIDSNIAANQDLFVFGADSVPSGNRHLLRLGYRNDRPAIQSTKAGVGNYDLLLNPDGGNVGIGLSDPRAALTIYKNGLQGSGVTNTLIAASNNTQVIDGRRQFLVQQWFNNATGRTFLVGNGFVSGTSAPVANHSAYGTFSGLEFADNRFSMIWNNNGTITPALTMVSGNGNIGIGNSDPNDKLDVAGDIRVRGKLIDEQGRPTFFVNVYLDDCGWPHPYLGCPSGYTDAGRWHVNGPSACDGLARGFGYENGSISGGWMALCASQ